MDWIARGSIVRFAVPFNAARKAGSEKRMMRFGLSPLLPRWNSRISSPQTTAPSMLSSRSALKHEKTEDRSTILRFAAQRPLGVQAEQDAAMAVSRGSGSEREHRAMRKIGGWGQQRQRFEIGLLPLSLWPWAGAGHRRTIAQARLGHGPLSGRCRGEARRRRRRRGTNPRGADRWRRSDASSQPLRRARHRGRGFS